MHRLLLLWALFGAFSAAGQYKGYTPLADPNPFRLAFMGASQKISSLSCQFTQEKSLSMLDEKMVSSGKFWFKKENKLRMEYNQPFHYLMVMNKGQVFIRDGNKESRISAGASKVFSQVNRIMIDCVQGTVLDNKDFSARIFEGKEEDLIELTPQNKSLKALFRNILIRVDRSDYTVSRIDMNELNGDNTLIRLTKKELNLEIPDSLFSSF